MLSLALQCVVSISEILFMEQDSNYSSESLGHTGNCKKCVFLPLLDKVASNGGEFCLTMFNTWEFCSLSLPWLCLILKEKGKVHKHQQQNCWLNLLPLNNNNNNKGSWPLIPATRVSASHLLLTLLQRDWLWRTRIEEYPGNPSLCTLA